MKDYKGISSVIVVAVIVVIAVVAVGAYVATSPQAPAKTTTITSTTTATTSVPTTTTPGKVWKFGAVCEGTVQDADFGMIGYVAANKVADYFGIKSSFSEGVKAPDSYEVLRGYVLNGYNIIWGHGSQFNQYVLQIARENPNVVCIIEADFPIENLPANVWNMGRNYYTGFYPTGVLAALKTKTNKIGYMVGADLPFAWAEVNAMKQGMDATKPGVQLKWINIGTFYDPTKGRMQANVFFDDGADIIVVSGGTLIYGCVAAAEPRPENTVWLISKYTHKIDVAPKIMLGGPIHDFFPPLKYIIEKIKAGQNGGWYEIQWGSDKGAYFYPKLANVTADVQAKVTAVVDQITSGALVVKANITKPASTLP